MKLTLEHEDLLKAVEKHIFDLGFNPSQVKVTDIDFKAGRGENGYSAEVIIDAVGSTSEKKTEGVKDSSSSTPEVETVKVEAEKEDKVAPFTPPVDDDAETKSSIFT